MRVGIFSDVRRLEFCVFHIFTRSNIVCIYTYIYIYIYIYIHIFLSKRKNKFRSFRVGRFNCMLETISLTHTLVNIITCKVSSKDFSKPWDDILVCT